MTNHWTEKSPSDYLFSIRFDFVYQLENQMTRLGLKHSELASRIGVTEGRVSQILNNRDNMTLRSMVKCARALGLKLSVVAYDDGDADNKKGPIPAEVFRACWEKQGRPIDMWDLQQASTRTYMMVSHPLHIQVTFPTLSGQEKAISTETGVLDYARGCGIPVHT